MLEGVDSLTYEATESATEGQVEGLWHLGAGGQGWVVVGLGARLADRDRGSTTPDRLRSEVQTRTLTGRIATGLAVHPAVSLLAGYTLERDDVRGRLPRVVSLPPDLRSIGGPEIALTGTPTTRHAPWGGVAWSYRPDRTVRLEAGWHGRAPRMQGGRIEATPDGSRRGWSLDVGVILR